MRHASFATGIGGFDLGFEQAGIESVFQCEIEPFCLQVLERHWPDVPKAHDLRSLEASAIPDADVWSCGFPCQDVSVAGKRAGLHGERSNLWFDFAGLVEQRRPEWLVVENVAGLLSSNGGADMALIVGQLSSFGYGVAWRVLDSRYFGVPQRRRRVYVVGHLGDLSAAEVLFERKSGGGGSETGREAGQDVAYSLTSSVRGSGDGHGQGWNTTYALSSRGPGERLEREASYVIESRSRSDATPDFIAGTLRVGGRDNKHRAADSSDNTPIVAYNIVGTGQKGRSHAYETQVTGAIRRKGNSANGNEAGTLLSASVDPNGVRETPGVPRQLDSPRYRALGNAVTANVAYWLGRRILDAT